MSTPPNAGTGSKPTLPSSAKPASSPAETPPQITVLPPHTESSGGASPPGARRPAGRPGESSFDQPVILQQTATWSRSILWLILLSTSGLIAWAALFQIEEAVQAQGQLEPQGQVKDVQAPVNGVVRDIRVTEGQTVQQGEVLFTLDPRIAQAEYQALTQVRQALRDENRLFWSNLSGGTDAALRPTQQALLQASQAELASRVNAAEEQVKQLQQQLTQNQVALKGAREQLALNQRILDDLKPLVDEGGLARVQYIRQEQEVLRGTREIERLTQEDVRLNHAIAQATEQLRNTQETTRRDLLTRIAENDKRINELDGQISRSQVLQQYQEVRAPASGVVFDLKATAPGYVVNTTEPVLKLVPTQNLVAKVYISNADIGFVQPGMKTEVRVDSFPFSEFGDIQGTVRRIGSDALPPDDVHRYFRFPAEITLDRQTIQVNGRPTVLQSGMSVTANMRTRKRSVLSIFTDMFSQKIESFRFVR